MVKLRYVLRNAVSYLLAGSLHGWVVLLQYNVSSLVLLCTVSQGNDQHGIVQLVTTLDSSNEANCLQTAARILTTAVLLRHSCIVTSNTK